MSDTITTGAHPDTGLVARLASRARGLKEALQAATAERDTLRARAAQLEQQVAELGQRTDATAAAARVEELTAELRGLRHRAVFERVAAARKARPEAIEDLWQLSGYRPEADQADEAALGQLLDAQAKQRPYLFADAGQGGQTAAEPPRPGPASGQGGPAAAPGKMAVSRKDLTNTQWMAKHGKALSEAFAADNVHWVD